MNNPEEGFCKNLKKEKRKRMDKKSHWLDYSNMHKYYWEYYDDDLEVVWGSSPTKQEIESGWVRLPGAEELARNRITRVQNPIYKHTNRRTKKKREIEEDDDYIEPSQNRRRSPQRILSPTTILKGYLSPVKLIEFDSSPFTPSTPEDLKQITREWEEDKKLWNR